MPTVPRPPPKKHKRTYHTQRKANKTIPGNCYRPVLLCWARLSNYSGLLHWLAWYHPHETQHHYIPTTRILQDCYPRYHLVRRRTTIYFHQIQSIFTTMGLSAQDIITIPSPKQQKIESTIKLKNLFTQHGLVAFWTMTNSVMYSLLLQYTPSRKDRLSPAQKLYGNPTQDTLPAHRCSFSQE